MDLAGKITQQQLDTIRRAEMGVGIGADDLDGVAEELGYPSELTEIIITLRGAHDALELVHLSYTETFENPGWADDA